MQRVFDPREVTLVGTVTDERSALALARSEERSDEDRHDFREARFLMSSNSGVL